MKKISIIAILLLCLALPAYALVVGYSRTFGGEAYSCVEIDEIYSGNNIDNTPFENLGTSGDESAGFNILASTTYSLDKLTVRLKKVGSPTGSIYAYIYETQTMEDQRGRLMTSLPPPIARLTQVH